MAESSRLNVSTEARRRRRGRVFAIRAGSRSAAEPMGRRSPDSAGVHSHARCRSGRGHLGTARRIGPGDAHRFRQHRVGPDRRALSLSRRADLFALHVFVLHRLLTPAHRPAALFGTVVAAFGLVIMAASSLLHVSTSPLAELYTAADTPA